MIVNDCKGKVMRIIKKEAYYFNQDGIYVKTSCYDAKKMKLKGLAYNRETGQYYQDKDVVYFCWGIIGEIHSNPIDRAIACLKLGDNTEKLNRDVERFKKMYEKKDFKLTNTVIRINGKKFYFFDENGKYTYLTEKNILPSDVFIENVQIIMTGNIVYYFSKTRRELAELIKAENQVLLRVAMVNLKVGDTIQNLKNNYENATLQKIILPEGVQRFVTRISRPEFVCTPENPNKNNTFDYIHVYIGIVSEWETDRKKYIKDNIREINNMVLDKLRNDRSFLKYGVPEKFLRVAKITLIKRTSELHYVFELKKID